MHRVPHHVSAVVLVPVDSPGASLMVWAACGLLLGTLVPESRGEKVFCTYIIAPWLLACLPCHLHVGPDNLSLSLAKYTQPLYPGCPSRPQVMVRLQCFTLDCLPSCPEDFLTSLGLSHPVPHHAEALLPSGSSTPCQSALLQRHSPPLTGAATPCTSLPVPTWHLPTHLGPAFPGRVTLCLSQFWLL